ncbi:MAG TPA: tetratricopeptide repeat protein [Thermoanaerobaculia bacterium]|nr:tetratricopeptide repeat protein [Thermoanaerobaculia bacterium]
MHKLSLLLLLHALTVNEVIDRHLAARGGAEKIKAVRTLVFSRGTYHEGSYTGSGNAFMAFARPFYRLVGDPEGNADIMEGYDGSPWEFYREPGVVVRTIGHAAGAARRGTYIDWRLGELRGHGSRVELGAEETIGGRPAYRVIVTTRDDFAHDYFIDKENFLLLADRYHAPVHAFGESVKTEGRFSDWRDVSGVLIPFKAYEVDLATGKELNSMQWGKIEINRELPASWFLPPQYSRSRLQTLLEQLYNERADAAAVRWSYADFRETYPDVDTRAGIEAIGYQMLKMGDHAAAIALLETNARDYPNAATSAFGLGRAYATAGDKTKARAEYERALRLDPAYKRAADALKSLQ